MVNPTSIPPQIAYMIASGTMADFDRVAKETGLERSLLLAIASRESHMGMMLDENWLGDHGNGIGIMQIDRRYHPVYANTYSPSNHYANIRKAAEVLKTDLKNFGGNKYQALAAYNAGPNDVRLAIRQGLDPDLFTTGQDYAKDVLARYEIIRKLTGDKQKDIAIKALLGISLFAVSGTAYYISHQYSQQKK